MKTDVYFGTRSTAWRFMRLCDDSGLMAGFPECHGHNFSVTVEGCADRIESVASLATVQSAAYATAFDATMARLRGMIQEAQRLESVFDSILNANRDIDLWDIEQQAVASATKAHKYG